MFFQFQLFFSVDLEYYTKMFKTKHSPRTTNNPYGAEELRSQLERLDETGRNMLKRIENLEARPFSSELTQDDILELKQKVEDLLTQYNQLLTLPDELAKQQVEIEQLRKENEELKAKVECLESKIQNLELGQVMTVFERNLAQFVLHPTIKKLGENAGIIYMLECLGKKGKKLNKIDKNKLDERWEKFQNVLKSSGC